MFQIIVLAIGIAIAFYAFSYYFLRRIFRRFERDIALVALNVSAYPVLVILILASIKLAISRFDSELNLPLLEASITACIIVAVGY